MNVVVKKGKPMFRQWKKWYQKRKTQINITRKYQKKMYPENVPENKKKSIKIEVNVCDRTIVNQLNEMGFICGKFKRKLAIPNKLRKMRLKFARGIERCHVDN